MDTQAASIQWGIEIETRIPDSSGVGLCHAGCPVCSGLNAATALPIEAPSFNGATWEAERDGSIRCDAHKIACEFVSLILHGEAGVEHFLAGVVDAIEILLDLIQKIVDARLAEKLQRVQNGQPLPPLDRVVRLLDGSSRGRQ